MPNISFSNDYPFGASWHMSDSVSNCFDRNYGITPPVTSAEKLLSLSPTQVDEILSRKLYRQLKATSGLENAEQSRKQRSESLASSPLTRSHNSTATLTSFIDPELNALIDRFFHLTYLNTVPMVNLLATAVATNFLKESIRDLDKKLQEQSATHLSHHLKRGTSFLCEPEDDNDDNISWSSAPT